MLKLDAVNNASKAILASRRAIETLIDQTPGNNEYALGLLGPILSELRTAEQAVSTLQKNALGVCPQ